MEKDNQYPSSSEQIKNFGKSAFKVLKGIFSGDAEIIASAEEQRIRQEICNRCKFKDVEQNRCTQCGCDLNMKISFALSDCPIEKWNRDDDAIEKFFYDNLDKNINSD